MQVPFKAEGPIVGLTGSLGAGKSTVSEYLKKEGLHVIDFDAQVNIIRQQYEVEQALLKRFGTTEPRKIRVMIKKNPVDKMFISTTVAIPALKKTLQDTNDLFKAGAKVVVWDGALLLETNSHLTLSGLVLVTAKEELRLERVRARDKTATKEELEVILEQQWNEEKKIATLEHYPRAMIVTNESSLQDLKDQVPGIIDFIFSVAFKHRRL